MQSPPASPSLVSDWISHPSFTLGPILLSSSGYTLPSCFCFPAFSPSYCLCPSTGVSPSHPAPRACDARRLPSLLGLVQDWHRSAGPGQGPDCSSSPLPPVTSGACNASVAAHAGEPRPKADLEPERNPAVQRPLFAGYPAAKPEIICKIEQKEEPWMRNSQNHRRGLNCHWGSINGIENEKVKDAGYNMKDPEIFTFLRKSKSIVQVPLKLKNSSRKKSWEKQAFAGRSNVPQRPLGKKKPPTCAECDKSFKSNTALIIHERSHTGERPYKCLECGKGFPSKGDLKRHGKIHIGKHDAMGEMLKDAPSEQSLLKHRRPAPRRPHVCLQCGKGFKKAVNLKKHINGHLTERPFVCGQCGQCFRLKQILVSHQRTHVGERPYCCPQCGKCFSQKHHLRSHHRVHTGERPFTCSLCSRCFSQKHHLVSHQRIHTGERPFTCVSCGKSFKDKKTLTIHCRVHTGERPYTCSECGKACSQKQHLKSHLRVHRAGGQGLLPSCPEEKPYQCKVCRKAFRDKRIMLTHQKTHDKEPRHFPELETMTF